MFYGYSLHIENALKMYDHWKNTTSFREKKGIPQNFQPLALVCSIGSPIFTSSDLESQLDAAKKDLYIASLKLRSMIRAFKERKIFLSPPGVCVCGWCMCVCMRMCVFMCVFMCVWCMCVHVCVGGACVCVCMCGVCVHVCGVCTCVVCVCACVWCVCACVCACVWCVHVCGVCMCVVCDVCACV